MSLRQNLLDSQNRPFGWQEWNDSNSVSEDNEQKEQEEKEDQKQNFNNQSLINYDIVVSLETQSYFRLPSLKTVKITNDDFEKSISNFPTEIQDASNQIKNYMNQAVHVWDIKQKGDKQFTYNFSLPPSGFKDQYTPIITYQQRHFEQEINEVKPLSDSQIKTVVESGTFEIPSQNFPMPYLWKLSQWVVKGSENVTDSFYQDISLCFHQLLQIRQRFSNDVGHPSLIKGMKQIIQFPVSFIQLLVGFRSLYPVVTPTMVHYKIERVRQKKLNQSDQFQVAIFRFVSETVSDIEDETLLKSQLKQEVISRQKFKQLIEEGSLSQDIKTHLQELIEYQRQYKLQMELRNNTISQREIQINSQLKAQHPIKYRVSLYRKNELEKLLTPEIAKIEYQTQLDIKELLSQQYPNQSLLYDNFLNFQRDYSKTYEQTFNKYQIKYQRPSKTFKLYNFFII